MPHNIEELRIVHAEIVDLYRAREHNYEHGMSIEIDNKQGLTISEAVDGNQEDRMFDKQSPVIMRKERDSCPTVTAA